MEHPGTPDVDDWLKTEIEPCRVTCKLGTPPRPRIAVVSVDAAPRLRSRLDAPLRRARYRWLECYERGAFEQATRWEGVAVLHLEVGENGVTGGRATGPHGIELKNCLMGGIRAMRFASPGGPAEVTLKLDMTPPEPPPDPVGIPGLAESTLEPGTGLGL